MDSGKFFTEVMNRDSMQQFPDLFNVAKLYHGIWGHVLHTGICAYVLSPHRFSLLSTIRISQKLRILKMWGNIQHEHGDTFISPLGSVLTVLQRSYKVINIRYISLIDASRQIWQGKDL